MNEKINIDEELDNLKDFEQIEVSKNFQEIIYFKLDKNRNSGKRDYIKSGTVFLLILIINILSVFSVVKHQEEAERETILTSVINSFSLDK